MGTLVDKPSSKVGTSASVHSRVCRYWVCYQVVGGCGSLHISGMAPERSLGRSLEGPDWPWTMVKRAGAVTGLPQHPL